VLGSASCLPSEIRRRASIGRTHVVVDGGDEAGRSAERAAEVALPPRLLRRIGTPGRSFEDRAAWRDRAAAVELGATRQPGRDRGLGI
jgi:hypothetical protein